MLGWVVVPISIDNWNEGAGELSSADRLRRIIRRRVAELQARGQGADLGPAEPS